MNSFMGSCNLYRNWQSILTLFCCTLFYLDSNNLSLLPMSLFLDNCVLCFQCTSLQTLELSVDKKNSDLNRLPKSKLSSLNPLHLSSFVNRPPSEEEHLRAIASKGNTNLRLFSIPTKWFFWITEKNMCFHIECVISKKGGHTSNSL